MDTISSETLRTLGPLLLLKDPICIAGAVCLLLIYTGFSILKNIKNESPLKPYILQVTGLTFLLPILLLMGILLKIQNEAIIGILGIIVGYIFGTSQKQQEAVTKKDTSDNGEKSTELAARS